MRRIRLLLPLFIFVVTFYTVCHAEESPLSLNDLLEARIQYENNWRESSKKVTSKKQDVKILLKQPLHQNSIIVLLYDSSMKGRHTVEILLHEGHLNEKLKSLDTKWYTKPTKWKLVEFGTLTGIFMGKLYVNGPHSTRVKVEYQSGNSDHSVVESEAIGMAFH